MAVFEFRVVAKRRLTYAAGLLVMLAMSCVPEPPGRIYGTPSRDSFSVMDRRLTIAGVEVTLTGADVSKTFFSDTGAMPIVGRLFAAQEFEADSAPVMLLHHEVWQTRFRGDPSIIGTQLIVDGRATTVLGVMPNDFNVPDRAQFWLPRR